jgi:fluoride exporter
VDALNVRRDPPDSAPTRPPLLRLSGLVATGGVAGTAARAALENAFGPHPGQFPWVTLAINLLGSFLLGLLLELLNRTGTDTGWRRAVRVGCGTGVIGGFTTYSTYVLEADQLARAGHLPLALAYLAVSTLAGLVAAGAGLAVAGRIVAPRGPEATA